MKIKWGKNSLLMYCGEESHKQLEHASKYKNHRLIEKERNENTYVKTASLLIQPSSSYLSVLLSTNL